MGVGNLSGARMILPPFSRRQALSACALILQGRYKLRKQRRCQSHRAVWPSDVSVLAKVLEWRAACTSRCNKARSGPDNYASKVRKYLPT